VFVRYKASYLPLRFSGYRRKEEHRVTRRYAHVEAFSAHLRRDSSAKRVTQTSGAIDRLVESKIQHRLSLFGVMAVIRMIGCANLPNLMRIVFYESFLSKTSHINHPCNPLNKNGLLFLPNLLYHMQ